MSDVILKLLLSCSFHFIYPLPSVLWHNLIKPTPCYKVNLHTRLHSKLLVFIASSRNFKVMRSSWLLFICILSGITATDSRLSCLVCAAENAKNCEGELTECPLATDKCISIHEVTKIGARDRSLFMRLCGNCSHDKPMTVRFDKGILKINVACCNTDACTPPEPTIPPEKPGTKDEKLKSNGIRCKSCFAENAKACDCNTFVNCSGEEMKCISRQISVSSGSYNHVAAIRGCATKDMCQYRTENITSKTMQTIQLRTSFTCSDDSDSVHNSLLLLVLTATMFSKFTTAM
ncbi:phospholipase A2 inhibitor and Ly6/PLAUR domain-containing protein-like [Bufo gargarizans]|uniref:phospholipase A2 inhibitor and Ly6/PLAUR domain-containing protein-like n=1 Tax=Bufo gargarizans TaxID=30331 RepID=UPI001CF2F0C1|nr:phospholipase A2 inhibitor and Ly6/PLAUR domain-containing protein-like [Bufo gargarizans]